MVKVNFNYDMEFSVKDTLVKGILKVPFFNKNGSPLTALGPITERNIENLLYKALVTKIKALYPRVCVDSSESHYITSEDTIVQMCMRRFNLKKYFKTGQWDFLDIQGFMLHARDWEEFNSFFETSENKELILLVEPYKFDLDFGRK